MLEKAPVIKGEIEDLTLLLRQTQSSFMELGESLISIFGPTMSSQLGNFSDRIEDRISYMLLRKWFDYLSGNSPTAVMARALNIKIDNIDLLENYSKDYLASTVSAIYVDGYDKRVQLNNFIMEYLDISYGNISKSKQEDLYTTVHNVFRGYFKPNPKKCRRLDKVLTDKVTKGWHASNVLELSDLVAPLEDAVYDVTKFGHALGKINGSPITHIVVANSIMGGVPTKLVVCLTKDDFDITLLTYILSDKSWLAHNVFAIVKNESDINILRTSFFKALKTNGYNHVLPVDRKTIGDVVTKYCSLFEKEFPAQIKVSKEHTIVFSKESNDSWMFRVQCDSQFKNMNDKYDDVIPWGKLSNSAQNRIKDSILHRYEEELRKLEEVDNNKDSSEEE
ncbi:MAG: hypothetical protein IBX57_00925 [Gammaproteobacteria bacterium]|nr:hypothetical protein [Gammaproteobacteria bacterium]